MDVAERDSETVDTRGTHEGGGLFGIGETPPGRIDLPVDVTVRKCAQLAFDGNSAIVSDPDELCDRVGVAGAEHHCVEADVNAAPCMLECVRFVEQQRDGDSRALCSSLAETAKGFDSARVKPGLVE